MSVLLFSFETTESSFGITRFLDILYFSASVAQIAGTTVTKAAKYGFLLIIFFTPPDSFFSSHISRFVFDDRNLPSKFPHNPGSYPSQPTLGELLLYLYWKDRDSPFIPWVL